MLKAISALAGLTRAMDNLPSCVLKETLLPLYAEVWPLMKVVCFQQRVLDCEIIEVTCTYLYKTFRALKEEMNPVF